LKEIVIFGLGKFAVNLYHYIKYDSRYKVIGFIADEAHIKDKTLCGLNIISFEDFQSRTYANKAAVLIGVGYSDLNRNREQIYRRLKEQNNAIVTYVHPMANVFSNNIGEGSIIIAGAVIEPNTIIGKGVVIWSNTVIAHDTVLEDFVWVASGTVISGDCHIGKFTFIGVNATVSNFVTTGKMTFIGAGALIHKKTKERSVYINKGTQCFRLPSDEFIKMTRL